MMHSTHSPRAGVRAAGLICLALAAAVGLPAASADDLPRGGQLMIGEDQRPQHFNPVHLNDMYTVRVVDLLFDGLVGYDIANQASQPALARAWRYDRALPGFVFDLRDDVTWHDGAPFTADDVVFTVDVMRNGKSWFSETVRGAEADGKHRVSIRLAQRPDDPQRALADLVFKILPRHAFPRGTRAVLPTDRFNQRPIGTGPYRLDEARDTTVSLVRADGPRPREGHLDSIRLHGAADKDLQKDSLRQGLLGMVVRVRPKDVKELRNARSELEVFEYASLNWWYLAFNHRNAPVRDKAFRQAVAFALDRDALRMAHLGQGWSISGPFAHQDLRNPRAVEPRARDLGKARDLLTGAGFRRDGQQRLVDSDGRPVRLRLLVQPPLGQHDGLLTDLVAQFAELGIAIEVDKAPDIAAWRATVRRGDGYDLVLGRWRSTRGDFLRPLFRTGGQQNWVGYGNPELDRLLDELRASEDAVARQKTMKALNVLLADELPYVFLWSLKDFSAYDRRSYQNLNLIHPFHYFSHVHHWARGERR